MVLKTIKFSLMLIAVVFISNSCYYDKEDVLYKYANAAPCDLTNITYSQTIAPIMNSNCVICHSKTNASGGVVLDNYTDLVNHMNRVWGDINHLSGYDAMPKGGNMLVTCDISKIQAWMNKGTPNN